MIDKWDFIMMLAICFVHYKKFQLKPTNNIIILVIRLYKE